MTYATTPTVGSNSVTDFAIPARIGSLLLIVVMTAFVPLWSYNGAAMAQGDFGWVRRNALRLSIGGAITIAGLGGILALCIDPIMQYWVGRSFPDQQLVIASMTIPATIIAAVAPWNMVLNAAGAVRVQMWGWSAFVAGSIGAKILLVPIFGAWVVSVVTGIAYLICIAPLMVGEALRLTRHPS